MQEARIKKFKKNVRSRAWPAFFVSLFMLIFLLVSLFSDPAQKGWVHLVTQLDNKETIKTIAIVMQQLLLVSIFPILYIIAVELLSCFVRTYTFKTKIIFFLSLLFSYLVATEFMLCTQYIFKDDSKYQLIIICLIFVFPIVFSTCFGFIYSRIVISGSANTPFNVSLFIILSILFPIAFFFLIYIVIAHYWTTLFIIMFFVILFDLFSYVFGSLFGKNKIAPKISPKKTWEGALCGAFIATGLTMLAIYGIYQIWPFNKVEPDDASTNIAYCFFGSQTTITKDWYTDNISWQWWVCMLFILLGMAVASFIGDILFSLFKRKNKIKDFSTLLKGHGGLLDRIDALIFVIFSYGLITIFMGILSMVMRHVNSEQDFYLSIMPQWDAWK